MRALLPAGVEVARYCKIRRFTIGGEADNYVAGTDPVIFEWQGIKVAPSSATTSGSGTVSSRDQAWRPGVHRHRELAAASNQHWIRLLEARAIENQAYIIGVNRCGSDPMHKYTGDSMIVDPRGQVLAHAGPEPGSISADWNLDYLLEYRRTFHFSTICCLSPDSVGLKLSYDHSLHLELREGHDFFRACKALGWHVIFLTVESLAEAPWPRESIDEFFMMPDLLNRQHVINAVSYLARARVINRIVALDEFDIEIAAHLREHLRVPGMGETTSRYFRDKLAMRLRAREEGIPVPSFVHVLNHDLIRQFMERVPPPWVLKPRSSAAAIGIKKISGPDELWGVIEALGDDQSFHLLEQFVPGDIYHVDSIISECEVVFDIVHKYGHPQ
jgi:hypothetical protein